MKTIESEIKTYYVPTNYGPSLARLVGEIGKDAESLPRNRWAFNLVAPMGSCECGDLEASLSFNGFYGHWEFKGNRMYGLLLTAEAIVLALYSAKIKII